MNRLHKKTSNNFAVMYVLAGILAILAAALASSCTTVESGHVGVVKRYGAVQPHPINEGINLIRPFWMESVYEMNARLQSAEAMAGASSKDLQGVSTSVTVQFSLVGKMAPRIYQRFGDTRAVAQSVLGPAVQDTVKAVTSRYTAEELITNRGAVKRDIEQTLRELVRGTLEKKGAIGAIEIANVLITDFNFSPEFDASIEAKVKAEQDALKAINEKKKKVTQAEANAAEKKLQADAIAYKIKVESEARAEAMTREANALRSQPALIELRRIERWDGKLPTYNGGGALPMLKIN